MDTKREATIKMLVPANKATPGQPVGPSLGQHGLNGMEFCRKFNEVTKAVLPKHDGILLPVKIAVFSGQGYTFQIKRPQTTYFLLLRKKNLDSIVSTSAKEGLNLSTAKTAGRDKKKKDSKGAKSSTSSASSSSGNKTNKNMAISVEEMYELAKTMYCLDKALTIASKIGNLQTIEEVSQRLQEINFANIISEIVSLEGFMLDPKSMSEDPEKATKASRLSSELEKLCYIILGTCKSMGIKIE